MPIADHPLKAGALIKVLFPLLISRAFYLGTCLLSVALLFSCASRYQNQQQGFEARQEYIEQWLKKHPIKTKEINLKSFEAELAFTEVKLNSAWYLYFDNAYEKSDISFAEVGKLIHGLKKQKQNELKAVDFRKGYALEFDQRLKSIEGQLLLGQIRRLLDQNRVQSALEQAKHLRLPWAKDIAYAMLYRLIPYYEEEWHDVLNQWGQQQGNHIKNIPCQNIAFDRSKLQKPWAKGLLWWHCPKALFEEVDHFELQLLGGTELVLWDQSPESQAFGDNNRILDLRGVVYQSNKRFELSPAQIEKGFFISATQAPELQQRLFPFSLPDIDPIIGLYFEKYLETVVYQINSPSKITQQQQALKPLIKRSQAFIQQYASQLEGAELDEKALSAYQSIREEHKTPFNALAQLMVLLYLDKLDSFDPLFNQLKLFTELDHLLPFLSIVRDHKLGLFKKEFELLKRLEQRVSHDKAVSMVAQENKQFCRVLKHFINFNSEAIQALTATQLWNCRYFDLAFERAVVNHDLDFITAVFDGSFEYFNQHANATFYWKSYLNAMYIKYPKEFYLLLQSLTIFKGLRFQALAELTIESQKKFLDAYGKEKLGKLDLLDQMTNLYDTNGMLDQTKNIELIWYLIDFVEKQGNEGNQETINGLIQELVQYETDDENIKNYLIAHPKLIPYSQYHVNEQEVIKAFTAYFNQSPQMKIFPYHKVLEHHRLIFQAKGSYVDYTKQIIYINSKEAIESLGEITAGPQEKLIKLYSTKPDMSIRYPILIPEKASYSLNDLQIGDFIHYESLTYIHSEQRIPRIVLGRLEPQHRQVPIFYLDDHLFLPKHLQLFTNAESKAYLQKHSVLSQGCDWADTQKQSNDIRLFLHHIDQFESLKLKLSCEKTKLHQHLHLVNSKEVIMPDYDEPHQPMLVQNKPYLSLYQPAELSQLWDIVHWEIGKRNKANDLFKAEVLMHLPHSLESINQLKQEDDVKYLSAMKENFQALLQKAKSDIKVNQELLQARLPHIAQKEEKGNIALYLSAMLEIAQIPYDLWLSMLEEKQRLSPMGLLGIDDYEYPLIEVFGELWDVHFLEGFPQLLPRGLKGTKLLKIWQFRPEQAGEMRYALNESQEKTLLALKEAFYDIKLSLVLKDEKQAVLKVLQNLRGELGIDLYERLKQVQEQELRQWISNQWNRWLGQHGLEHIQFEFKEGELFLSYELSFQWQFPFQFKLLPQLWQSRFATLPQRKHDLVLPSQNQDLSLEIKVSQPVLRDQLKASIHKALAKHQDIKSQFGSFSIQQQASEDGFLINAQWRLDQQSISPKDYEAFRKFATEVEAHEQLFLE